MNLIPVLSIIILAVVLPGGFLLWLLEFTRPPVAGAAIMPEYEPPADIGPAEAGVLVDNSFTPRDAAAMLVALKLRGVIEFTVVADKVESLKMIVPQGSAAPAPLERLVLDRVFSGRGTVSAAEARRAFAGLRQRLARDVRLSLSEKGYYADDRLLAGMIAGAAAVASAGLSSGLMPVIGFVGGFGVAAALVLLIELGWIAVLLRPRLTKKGRAALAHLQGFKMYLSAVEGERMKWAEEKKDMIDRFTPYAIVFGISPHWAVELQAVTSSLLEDWPLLAPRAGR